MEIIYQHDNILLERLKTGDEAAFNLLYDRYWEMVYKEAFFRLRDEDKSKDLTQEIFVKLWARREEQEIDNLDAYLKVAVRNRVLNLFEKEKHFVPIEELLLDTVSFSRENADVLALRNEFLRSYKILVESLPEKRKQIFKQYFEEGLSTEEIAERLTVSRKTVQNQLGRAIASIKLELTNLGILLVVLELITGGKG